MAKNALKDLDEDLMNTDTAAANGDMATNTVELNNDEINNQLHHLALYEPHWDDDPQPQSFLRGGRDLSSLLGGK